MTEDNMNEPQKPFITIDDVQINIEDLPEEGQGVFGRLQRLNQKKANMVIMMEKKLYLKMKPLKKRILTQNSCA
jgi:hypothetical protein